MNDMTMYTLVEGLSAHITCCTGDKVKAKIIGKVIHEMNKIEVSFRICAF
jgi:hypothetical protein